MSCASERNYRSIDNGGVSRGCEGLVMHVACVKCCFRNREAPGGSFSIYQCFPFKSSLDSEFLNFLFSGSQVV